MENDLTICYIVKNSINRLPESYQIMRNLSDKIIVIDTGSSDGTVAWAESRDDVWVNTFKWCNDFSKARNFAIKIAETVYDTKYILMIDDDEYIPEKFHEEIKTFLSKADKKYIFSFNVINFLESPTWIKEPKQLFGQAERLFENDGEIKYKNHVHEKLISDSHLRVELQIPLFHFQYKAYSVMLGKMAHYRNLIRKDIKKNNPTFIDEIHLANTYRESFRWY